LIFSLIIAASTLLILIFRQPYFIDAADAFDISPRRFRRRAIFAAAFITPLRYFIFSAMIAAIISSLRRHFDYFAAAY
jgi:hypothetical protein